MPKASNGRFVVLASGSGGNAAVLQTAGGAVLVDFGLAPRTLERRLKMIGLSWSKIRSAVLTHTHTDHWKRETLATFVGHGISVFVHPSHTTELNRAGDAYTELRAKGLWNEYEAGRSFDPITDVSVVPIRVPHDSDPTAAFRFDGDGWAVGYAADLGMAPPGLTDLFDGVSILGLEFNHDVQMQQTSRRPAILIRRILGDYGHLSNDQAVLFLRRLLDRCGDRLKHVVQLHLSRECNRPAVAAAAGRTALAGTTVQLTTASQDLPTAFLPLGTDEFPPSVQPVLPGCES